MQNNTLDNILKIIEEAISLLPDTSQEKLRKELETIREIMMKSRPPKMMVIGRRGAGKSSLINAIFGDKVAEVGSVTAQTAQGKWYRYQNERGKIDLLDTRGLGDRSRPDAAKHDNALEEIKAALQDTYPDVLLFLVKAKEVDARIQEDLQNLRAIVEFIKTKHHYTVPVMALITQVDELDPIDIGQPPYDDSEKQANIQKALKAVQDSFDAQSLKLMHLLPVSAYARYRGEVCIHQRYWNVDTLVHYLIEILPKEAQLELARLSQVMGVQKKIARLVIASSASICAGLAALPLPVADIIPITAAQVTMVTSIGYVAGRELNAQAATEFLAALGVNVGVGFALREVSRALAKFIFPGGGTLISSGIALGATWAIGEAAIVYFIEGLSLEEAKQAFQYEKDKRDEA